ncbi:hypothetical protein [Brevundimonas sp.]|uniref:hypothetical protein n=1 Tax=Brevundimonas sp. TaxID=1871086 RepID=UPI002FD8C9D4
MTKRAGLALAVAGAMTMSACATTGQGAGSGGGGSALDHAVARCAGTVLLTAAIGAVIGNNTGSGNAGRGAAIGAAGGVALCAILRQAQRDQAVILESEQIAATRGEDLESKVRGESGKEATLRHVVEAAPEQAARQRCRYVSTVVSYGQGEAPTGKQLYCESQTGTWERIDA